MALVGTWAMVACDLQAQVRASLWVDSAGPIKAGSHIDATLTIEITPGWHISSLTQPEGGPARTEISIPSGQSFRLRDGIIAPVPHKEFNTVFEIEVETYVNSVSFTLPLVSIEDVKPDATLAVEIKYQACSDKTCLIPKVKRLSCLVRGGKPFVGKRTPPEKRP